MGTTHAYHPGVYACCRRRLARDAPLLYLRGEAEGGEIKAYVEGFRNAGITNVRGQLISNAGHFSPEENPQEVWDHLKTLVDG